MTEIDKPLQFGNSALQTLMGKQAAPALAQPPVSGEARFHGQKWAPCTVEHVAMVLAAPHEWKGYEVRYLYADPVPAAQPITDDERRSLIAAAGFLAGSGWAESAAVLQRMAVGAPMLAVQLVQLMAAEFVEPDDYEDGDHPLVDRVRTFLASMPTTDADGYPTLPAGDHASAYVSDAKVFSASEMRAYVDADRALRAAPQAALAAVAVPDERAAFEAWAKSEDMSIGSDCDGYIHSNTAAASLAWQARAALAATPAAEQIALTITNNFRDAGWSMPSIDEARVLEAVKSALSTSPAAVPVVLTEPAYKLRVNGVFQDPIPAAHAFGLPDGEHSLFTEQQVRALLAQKLAIMPKGESAAAQLRAMATNYPTGHSWDKLDAKACIRGALEIEALRALLATATGLPAQAVDGPPIAYAMRWPDQRPDEKPTILWPEQVAAHGADMRAKGQMLTPIYEHPQAQADARDALTPAKPVHPKGMTSINARLSFNMGWMACERHHGIRAEDVEQAVATDAAIAAAKGE